MLKKIHSILLCLILILPSFSNAYALDYMTRRQVCDLLMRAADDYNPTLKEGDILRGYEDGSLRENEPVTRAQAVVMIKRAFGEIPPKKGNNARIGVEKKNFYDIPEWATEELNTIFDMGIIAGKEEGYFSPNDYVTRSEMDKYISRVYAYFGTNLKDSFYATVNKEYLENVSSTDIKEENDFAALQENIQYEIRELVRQALNKDAETPSEERMKILYSNFTNWEEREKAGFDDVRQAFDQADDITSVYKLKTARIQGSLAITNLGDFMLTYNPFDSNNYADAYISVNEGSDFAAYWDTDEKTREAMLKYMRKLQLLMGESEESAEENIEAFIAFNRLLSDINEKYPSTGYELYTMGELNTLLPNLNVAGVYEESGFTKKNSVLVYNIDSLKALNDIVTEENIPMIRSYIKLAIMDSYAPYTTKESLDILLESINAMDAGEREYTREDFILDMTAGAFPSYFSQKYYEKHYSEKAISDVKKIAEDVKRIYRKKLENNTWIGEQTRKNAITKLEKLNIKIGAPKYEKDVAENAQFLLYKDGGSVMQNVGEISYANWQDMLKREREKVDKSLWVVSSYTVNAIYDPICNDFTIPQAILQKPFYDETAPIEKNLGSIGVVIAHEISHAFDYEGALYDAEGNISDWWDEKDKENFYRKCQAIEEYYVGTESAPGINVDTERTLTENIADIGAISVVSDIASELKDPNYKLLYTGYAQMYRSSMGRTDLQYYAVMDTHAPSNVRVDRVLQTEDDFYKAFDIGEGDGMYIPKSERVALW